jgi:predicted MFS family arabinose efflux permease
MEYKGSARRDQRGQVLMVCNSQIVAGSGLVDESNSRRWIAVFMLMCVGVLNIVDRFLPAVLAQPIKKELLLSDTALGLINGFGFLVVYSVVGIPIARVSDRGRYGIVIGCCVAFWSAMTMLGGAAHAGWQLAMTRMGVALGEAGTTPAAHAFISKHFSPERRAAPLALLTLSVPIASMVGLLGGGMLGQALGWRQTFVIIGIIGFAVAIVATLILGKRRAPSLSKTPPGSRSTHSVGTLLVKRSFILILAASACIGVGGYSLTTFGPAFLMRTHHLSLREVGIYYGITSGTVGIVGLLLTGLLAEKLAAREPRGLLWVVASMIALCLPFSVATFFVSNRWFALGFMALANVSGTAYMVPVVAAIQRLTPPELRATASAIMLFCTALIGGAGPLVTGVISDALEPRFGAFALGRALLLVPAIQIVAMLLYAAASKTFRRDMFVETLP